MGCERHHQGAAPQPAGCRRTLLGVGVGVGVGLGLGLGLGLRVDPAHLVDAALGVAERRLGLGLLGLVRVGVRGRVRVGIRVGLRVRVGVRLGLG